MTSACTTSGVSSLSARPIISAARDSGVARIRSNAPVMISNCRFEPVMLVPNIVIMTTTPGRNHCSVLPPPSWSPPSPSPATPDSSGPNRPRKTSGCSSEKTSENGSRTMVSVSRVQTAAMSAARLRG